MRQLNIPTFREHLCSLALVKVRPLRSYLPLFNRPKFKRLGLLVSIGIFTAIGFTALTAAPSFAKMNADTSPEQRATAYSTYKVAYTCVRDHMRMEIRTVAGVSGDTSPAQGDKGLKPGDSGNKYEYEWFRDHDAWGVVYPAGKQDCYQAMNTMLDLTGMSGKQMLQAMGYKFNEGVPQWENPPSKAPSFKDTILDKVGNVNTLASSDAKHLLYLKAFTDKAFGSCDASKKMKYKDADKTLKKWADEGKVDGGVKYRKIKLAEGSSTVEYIYTYKSETEGYATPDGYYAGSTAYGATYAYRGAIYPGASNSEVFNCDDLAKNLDSTAASLATWNKSHGGQEVDSDDSETDTDGEDDEQSSCNIDGIGWLLCPVLTAGANLADSAYTFIADNFLQVDIKVAQADNSNGTYVAWTYMRTVANIAFVIAFLFIIYSQLTSFGITNYGVKKLLPRVIIAAILVNISFIVCQLSIDISNLLGYSLKSLLEGAATQIGATAGDATSGAAGDESGHLGGILLLIIGGGALIWFNLAAIILAIIMGFFILATIFAILIARQVLIILLVVVAPLAFVAFLLPNTEKLFSKWQKLFMQMLMIFPVVGLLNGAGILASQIIRTSAGPDQTLMQIAGYLALVIPLIATFALLKASLNAVGGIGAAINGTGRWAGRQTQSGAKRTGQFARQKGLGALANTKFGRNKVVRRIGGLASGNGIRGYDALGAAQESKSNQEILNNWQRDGTAFDPERLEEIARNKGNSAQGRAALSQLAAIGEAPRLADIRDSLKDKDGKVPAYYDRAIAPHYGALKAKDRSAVQNMSANDWGEIKQAEMHGMKDSAIRKAAAASPEFAQNLAAAINDPEQARNFSSGIRSDFGGGASAAQQVGAGAGDGAAAAPSPAPSSPLQMPSEAEIRRYSQTPSSPTSESSAETQTAGGVPISVVPANGTGTSPSSAHIPDFETPKKPSQREIDAAGEAAENAPFKVTDRRGKR